MFRPFVSSAFLPAFLIVTTMIPRGVNAQNDDAWKILLVQGTYASANAHDNAGAEKIFQKALHEAEKFGPDNVRVGATHNRLALVYREEKKYADAEASFLKALNVFEKVYGPDSIDLANVHFNIASLLLAQGKAPAAMSHLRKCLEIYRRHFGDESVKTAEVLCMLGDGLRSQKAWQEAEAPLKECAQVRERLGGFNSDLGEAENSLAFVYHHEGKYALADSSFKIAETIRERSKSITSPELAETLEGHAALLRQMGRDLEAEHDEKMAGAIRKVQARLK